MHLPADRGLHLSGPLRRTPLYELHLELGARMVPFAGYEMPVQYPAGLRAEHLWTRGNAGLFDVSHMGQLRVRGSGLHATLERALPVDFDGWPAGMQKYSLLLNERGGIEDDLMVTRLENEVAMVVNAACKERDLARLGSLCPKLEFSVLDHALIALQGPRAEEVFAEASSLKFMHARTVRFAGIECAVARSGYTGEDGFEISVSASHAMSLARSLLAHPAVRPVGLGARDTLRLEAALPLHGQDIDADTTPGEAGLGWAIARSRRAGGVKAGGFPGAACAEGGRRRFVGLLGKETVPVRSGARLVDAAQSEVGQVTSGTVSPTLSKPVMLAYIDSAVSDAAQLHALVRNQRHPVEIVPTPFVPKRYKR
ncbi:MAG TPA: glycine cleavage system aminomethyltransferase GcvT [Burkholderiales bacterium]|nr:glycine cleavage system aminomethyltransferase GcvT [Burkholderiales bacterium]